MGRPNLIDKALSKKRGRRIRKLDRAGRDAIEIAAIVGIEVETVYLHLNRKRGRWLRFHPPIRCNWCHALINRLPPEGQPCLACRTRWAMTLDEKARSAIIRA